MKDIINETLKKIKSEHIALEPRWKFLTKRYLPWVIFLLIASLAAFGISAAYDGLSQLDWDLYRFTHQNAFAFALSALPYVIFIGVAILLGFAFFDLRKTENGYRFSFLKIFLITIVVAVGMGLLFSTFGFGRRVNVAMTNNLPGYGSMMMTPLSQWSQPENGLLSGVIQSVSVDGVSIQDFQGNNWDIAVAQDANIRPAVNMVPGQAIKIIGSKIDSKNFKAQEIRPWMGQGMMGRGQQGAGAYQGGGMMGGGRGSMMGN